MTVCKLTRLEQSDAANALVEWFNSQELGPADAEAIMHRVQAKLLVARVNRNDVFVLQEAIAEAQLRFVHEANERLHQVWKDKRRG